MTDYSQIVDTVSEEDLVRTGGSSSHTPYDRALLRIDEDGAVTLSVRTYFGGDGTPESEWHRRTLVFPISGNPDRDDLRETLGEGGEASVLIERIIAGHSTKWNGSNMVGELTTPAEEAQEELLQLLDNVPSRMDLQAWGAGEWLFGGNSSRAILQDVGLLGTPDEAAIERAAATLVQQARGDGVLLDQSAVARELKGAIESLAAEGEAA